VCGTTLTGVGIDDAQSALEALCISPLGDLRLQLTRQLTAAALSAAGGGASFVDFAMCNAICADPGSPSIALSDCITDTDVFNNSGDALTAPFDPPGAANPGPCQLATDTPCTVLLGSGCAVP